MNWIKRDLEDIISQKKHGLNLFPVWLLLGPRQVGKTSLFKQCAESNRTLISLDDFDVRIQANRDPKLFLQTIQPPFLIDEIQYAPLLLPQIKMLVDHQSLSAGSVWLTGSQNFSVMQNVRESLAGRVAIMNLLGFSDSEKLASQKNKSVFDSMLESSFPKLFGITDIDSRNNFLKSYLQTYIEKDVIELGGITKRREFEIFVKMCAFRTGQILEVSSLAKDVGISPNTAKDWLSVLEDSFLIRLVHPYYANRNKRMIKSPKLYFLDTGLCAYLAGWRDVEQITFGPMAGALFETHIFGQILRFFEHHYRDFQIHFWRTKDGEEIDFLIEANGLILPIEIKLNPNQTDKLVNLKKLNQPNWQEGHVVSSRPGMVTQNGWTSIVTIENLPQILSKFFSPVL